MATDCIGVARSTTPPVPPVLDPARLTWGSAETFQLCTEVDLKTALYWATRVYRPAHNISHPASMPDCPGCQYEKAVAR